jgi:2,3-bisphosphoglycerate-independent phosphoglycerate mutase
MLTSLLALCVLLTTALVGTDPLKDNLPLVPCVPTLLPGGNAPDVSAVMTAKLVSELSDVMRAVLEQHPVNTQRAKEGRSLANVVLLRWIALIFVLMLLLDLHLYP